MFHFYYFSISFLYYFSNATHRALFFWGKRHMVNRNTTWLFFFWSKDYLLGLMEHPIILLCTSSGFIVTTSVGLILTKMGTMPHTAKLEWSWLFLLIALSEQPLFIHTNTFINFSSTFLCNILFLFFFILSYIQSWNCKARRNADSILSLYSLHGWRD